MYSDSLEELDRGILATLLTNLHTNIMITGWKMKFSISPVYMKFEILLTVLH